MNNYRFYYQGKHDTRQAFSRKMKHIRTVRVAQSCQIGHVSQLSRWRHLTKITRIQFVLLFLFKFFITRGLKITKALISMRQAKTEGFWYL